MKRDLSLAVTEWDLCFSQRAPPVQNLATFPDKENNLLEMKFEYAQYGSSLLQEDLSRLLLKMLLALGEAMAGK